MTDAIRCESPSWIQVVRMVRQLANDIRAGGFRPDLIVAIARGGYVPGRLLADHLGLMDLTSIRIEHYLHGAQKQPCARMRFPLSADVSGRRVLIVDDVSDTGDTFELASAHMRERIPAAEIRTAALHHKTVSRFVPDFYARRMTRWRWIVYPWALIEDVGGFVQRMESRPDSVDAILGRLRADHGLRVSRTVVEDVLARWRDR